MTERNKGILQSREVEQQTIEHILSLRYSIIDRFKSINPNAPVYVPLIEGKSFGITEYGFTAHGFALDPKSEYKQILYHYALSDDRRAIELGKRPEGLTARWVRDNRFRLNQKLQERLQDFLIL